MHASDGPPPPPPLDFSREGATSLNIQEVSALSRVVHDLGFALSEVDAVRLQVSDSRQVVLQLSSALTMYLAYGPDETVEEMVRRFADQIQDHLLELGSIMPTCPGHPHPRVASLEGDRAEWICPKDAERCRTPIGGI